MTFQSAHFTRVSRTLKQHDAVFFAFEFTANLSSSIQPCNLLAVDFRNFNYGFSENPHPVF